LYQWAYACTRSLIRISQSVARSPVLKKGEAMPVSRPVDLRQGDYYQQHYVNWRAPAPLLSAE